VVLVIVLAVLSLSDRIERGFSPKEM